MKKIIINISGSFLAITICLTFLFIFPMRAMAATQCGSLFLYGDVIGDGNISIKDVTMIQEHLAGMIYLNAAQQFVADVNGDEVVNLKDATLIQKYVAKMVTSFPTPTGNYPPQLVALDNATSDQMKVDYIAFLKPKFPGSFGSTTIQDVSYSYYGTYNGVEAVDIYCLGEPVGPMFLNITIAGYHFSNSIYREIYIYTNSTFIDLSTAYDQGIVSKEDVHNILFYYEN